MASGITDLVDRGFRELIESVPAALYVAEPGCEGRWDYVSPQIETILGYPAAAWIDDPGLWSRQLHPADRERVLEREERERRCGALELSRAEEYRLIHRSGREVWIRDEASLHGHPGPHRWRGMLSDITIQRRELELIERELAAAQRRLVSLLAGIEDHLGVVDGTLHRVA